MILVAGATGLLGTEICRRLMTSKQAVRALVRSTSDQAKVNNLKDFGVTMALGDLKNRASLDVACRKISTVISTVSTTFSKQPDDSIPVTDQAGQINLIEAAKGAGVSHFIYISLSRNLNTESPLITAKRTVEQYLKDSGMSYTILRPSCFMEVWLSPMVGFDFPNAKAQIYGEGQKKLSWISLGDVAQFAIACVDNPVARNNTIELGGPDALSPLEVVRIFEGVLAKKFEVQFVPEKVLREQKAQASDLMQQTFSGLMLDYAKGDQIDMLTTLKLFPMHLTSVKEYAERSLVSARR